MFFYLPQVAGERNKNLVKVGIAADQLGMHRSVQDLEAAINSFLDRHNARSGALLSDQIRRRYPGLPSSGSRPKSGTLVRESLRLLRGHPGDIYTVEHYQSKNGTLAPTGRAPTLLGRRWRAVGAQRWRRRTVGRRRTLRPLAVSGGDNRAAFIAAHAVAVDRHTGGACPAA
jgi:hypothetical protein